MVGDCDWGLRVSTVTDGTADAAMGHSQLGQGMMLAMGEGPKQ